MASARSAAEIKPLVVAPDESRAVYAKLFMALV
jgi:hypothetical protein